MSDPNNSQQQKTTGKKSPESFPVKLPPAPSDPQSQSSTDSNNNSHVNTNGQPAHHTTDSNDGNPNEDTNGMGNQNGQPNESRLRAVSSADEYFKNQTKTAKFSCRVSVTGTIPGRQYHTAINYEDFMFVYGGFSVEKSVCSELYCFHYGTRSWTLIENDVNTTQLTPRYDHSAIVYGDSMFIFGGMSPHNTLLDDLWEFKFETQSWSVVPHEAKPSARKGHTAVVHENNMYVIGGINSDNKPLDDVWEFSFDTFRWTKLGGASNFPGRYHHTSVVFKDSIFVFGGSTISSNSAAAESRLSDFWEYKIKNKTWSALTIGLCPPGRSDHSAVVFQNSMYLCGGGESGLFEIFEFDFDFRKWFKIQLSTGGEVPPPKQAFSAVVRGDCIFFFGGSPIGNTSDPTVLQDLDYLCLGKDEFEEELELDEMAKMQNIPKSLWEATCMKKHPEVLELREKIRPLSESMSYARSVTSARTEAKSAVSHRQVLQLIMEYLDHQGFSKVVETIQEESSIPLEKSNYEESRLLTLMRIGRRRIRHKDVFSSDITLADYDETDPEVQVVDRLPKRSLDALSEQQDVNIWDEIIDCYTNGSQGRKNIMLVTPEGVEITTASFQDKVVIKGATLNRLVQVLTSEKEKVQDVQFAKTFLYTYQSFTSPEMLLKKLIQRYHVPYPLPKDYMTANTYGFPSSTDATSDVISLDNFKTELQQPIRTRVCNVIKYWIDRCGWDFDEKLQSSLKSFIDGPLSRDGNLSLVKQLRNSMSKLQKKKFFLEEDRAYIFGVNPPEPKVPRNIFSPNLSLKDIDEVEIARQLTLIEYGLFSQIIPTELLNKCWCDADKRHKAPHIMEMQTRFDDIANWVATTILTVDSQSTTPSSTGTTSTTSQSSSASLTNTKKARARMIEKYIKIAEHLKTLKNFQTLFAILTGLNSSVITCLTQTFAELQLKTKETLNELLGIMSKESNYKTYREFLRYSALPCIPYIEVTLKDILSIEEQGDYIGNMINFQKRQQLYKAITTLQGYQQRPYNLQPVHQIATFLNNFSRKDEKDLSDLAAKLEPKK